MGYGHSDGRRYARLEGISELNSAPQYRPYLYVKVTPISKTKARVECFSFANGEDASQSILQATHGAWMHFDVELSDADRKG